jgi:hypothetical protein
MMVCLAVKKIRFSVWERVLDKFLNPFIYRIVEFIAINKWLRKVFLVSTDLKKPFLKVS